MNSIKKLEREELFVILNGKISMRISRYLSGKFREAGLGITVEQWTVLACLWEKDKVTQQTLSDITNKDKTSMTRLIDNLEKRKLVKRVSDPSDRRAKLIYLTEDGIRMEKKSDEIVTDVVEKTLSELTEEEVMTCRNVLKKIFDNLI